jgi:chromosome segregation ATPase
MLGSQERKNLEARVNGQAGQLTALQNAINEQNRVITELNTSGTATKAQLQEAVAKLAELNAQLTTATDTIKDLQNNPDTQLLDQGKGVFAWITKLLNRLKG